MPAASAASTASTVFSIAALQPRWPMETGAWRSGGSQQFSTRYAARNRQTAPAAAFQRFFPSAARTRAQSFRSLRTAICTSAALSACQSGYSTAPASGLRCRSATYRKAVMPAANRTAISAQYTRSLRNASEYTRNFRKFPSKSLFSSGLRRQKRAISVAAASQSSRTARTCSAPVSPIRFQHAKPLFAAAPKRSRCSAMRTGTNSSARKVPYRST